MVMVDVPNDHEDNNDDGVWRNPPPIGSTSRSHIPSVNEVNVKT